MKRISDLPKDREEHALELYRKSIVIDCHLDSAMTDEYLEKMRESGVTAVNLDGGTWERLAEIHKFIDEHRDALLGPVTTSVGISEAKRKGKIAIFVGAENANESLESRSPPFGAMVSSTNLDFLLLYHRLGLRILQPAYNNRNAFADGCAEKVDVGLSNLGLELIERMNRLSMIVDCSHVSRRTTLDVCKHARFVISTHANARAVCENARNRSDEEIKAIAERDGVLGMVAFPTFLKWTDTEKGKWPHVEDLLDHVDYIGRLVGTKHVGIGLDLVEGTDTLGPIVPGKSFISRYPELYGKPGPGGFLRYAEGMNSISDLPNFAKGLVARGYSDQEVQGVLGENWLRVFKKAWGE